MIRGELKSHPALFQISCELSKFNYSYRINPHKYLALNALQKYLSYL